MLWEMFLIICQGNKTILLMHLAFTIAPHSPCVPSHDSAPNTLSTLNLYFSISLTPIKHNAPALLGLKSRHRAIARHYSRIPPRITNFGILIALVCAAFLLNLLTLLLLFTLLRISFLLGQTSGSLRDSRPVPLLDTNWPRWSNPPPLGSLWEPIWTGWSGPIPLGYTLITNGSMQIK